MAYASQSFRARTNPYAPAAHAVCDGCGGHYNRIDLKPQYEFQGIALADTGFRYCWRCISKPQPQLKPVILPQDPVPIRDPRPEVAQAGLGDISGQLPYPPVNGNLNGFTQIVGPQSSSLSDNIPTAELDPTRPFTAPADVIASADTGWGLPRPALTLWQGTIALSGVGQVAVPANSGRTYLLVYNPASGVLAVAQDAAPVLGISSASVPNQITPYPPVPAEVTTIVAPTGSALLQNAGWTPPSTVWTGEIWVLGLVPGAPWWIWEG